MKKSIAIILLACTAAVLSACPPQTYKYAERDTCDLYLDFYKPSQPNGYSIIYVFGGGFISGSRNMPHTVPFYESMAEKGYNVFAIDYRLGMKGRKIGNLPIKPLEEAVDMSTEDLFSSVDFIIRNSGEFLADPDKIIIMGSSAGAITVLEADYLLSRREKASCILPGDFRFAGVISLSGAVFSREGRPDYAVHSPSPTFFIHGTEDRLVTYKKIRIANIGFFGSDYLARLFGKEGYPYAIKRYKGLGHGVAAMEKENIDDICRFIDTYVKGGRKLQADRLYYDPEIKRNDFGHNSISDMYKGTRKGR